mmetsp:Transcript_39902/g.113019  ORF Transcript_39902/g.113019 Transcript_39902/m.113019 type:complete len:214 (+) Transcript_39902:521-1162(+)
MASDTAAWPAWASWMAASFSTFSVKRSAVWLAMAACVSFIDTASALCSFSSCMRSAWRESMSMRKPSISCVFDFRVCALVANSLSHQPLCSVSRKASVFKRSMSSWMRIFTFASGSSRSCDTTADNTELRSRDDSPRRNAAALAWPSGDPSPRNCSSAAPAVDAVRRWAAALTSLLDMISMAFSSAAISSARVPWRALYSSAFCAQSAVSSVR